MSQRDDPFWTRAQGDPPRIFAHRGNTDDGEAFENTISAYDRAAREGVDGIEVDVSRTRDGRLICFHDRSLKRISGSEQRVRNTPFSTIRSIPLEGGERVPTLDEAFQVIPPSLPVILDLKTVGAFDGELVDAVLRFLKKVLYEDERRILVTAFNYVAVRAIKMRALNQRCGLLLDRDSFHSRVGMMRFFARSYQAVNPHFSLVTARNLAQWRASGLRVIAWTVNDPQDARRVAHEGVDGIITDAPRAVREAVRE